MTDRAEARGPAAGPGLSSGSGVDLAFARLVEELTRKIQDGEPVDDHQIAAEYPGWADTIRELMPALRDLAALGRSAAPDRAERSVPVSFGDFRIIREVGRGGMGVVYEAEQISLGRRVALKILPIVAAMDARAARRFQLEAQVAGLLQHPRIVPVYDVGQFEGVPFYAMQFIDGGNLADLIRALREPGTASPSDPDSEDGGDAGAIDSLVVGLVSGRFAGPGPARAEVERSPAPRADGPAPNRGRAFIREVARLGIQAAEALEYAHSQGIVHRDVKPANLLLDRRGDLWVADFGMAEVAGDAELTLTGDRPGTLRYMSPEQAMGRRALVDRRTDVYALGLTLYELLALRPAVAGEDRAAIYRQITEDEPTPIRQVNPSVPVDLATILSRASAKEPESRYGTAGLLADDLQRFLDGRPIAARAVGPLARSWRWCRRKPLLAGLAAGLLLACLGGVGAITWGWREAVRQRGLIAVAERRARSQGAIAEAINRFLLERILSQGSPETNPDAKSVTLLEVIHRASAEVGTSFPGQPEIEAAVRLMVGKVFHELGEYAPYEAQIREARRLASAGGVPADPRRDAELAAELGHALAHLRRPEQAEPLIVSAVEASRALGSNDPVGLAASDYLADLRANQGRLDEAEAIYRRNLDRARAGANPDRAFVFGETNNLALLLFQRRRFDEAEGLCRRLVDEVRRERGPNHPSTLSATNTLAILLEKRGQYAEAERLFREVAEGNRRVLGPNHPGNFAALYNLAQALADLGRFAEAEAALRQSLDAQRQVLPPDHPTTLKTTSQVASVLNKQGRADEAAKLLRPCLEAQRRVLGPGHEETALTARRLDIALGGKARPTTPTTLTTHPMPPETNP